MNTVVGALLPLIVTLALGFFAAWRHEFTAAQASVLNRMVLLYALPLLLFAGTVTIKRSTLTSDLGLAECGHLNWPRLGRLSSRILAPPGW